MTMMQRKLPEQEDDTVQDDSSILELYINLNQNAYWYNGYDADDFMNNIGHLIDPEYASKLSNGTLLDEDIQDITDTISCDSECGAILTLIDISLENRLETLVEETKRLIIKEKAEYLAENENDPEAQADVDKLAKVYGYFKLGQYYFYIFIVDSLLAYKHTF